MHILHSIIARLDYDTLAMEKDQPAREFRHRLHMLGTTLDTVLYIETTLHTIFNKYRDFRIQ